MMPYSIFPEHLFCRPRRHTLIFTHARAYIHRNLPDSLALLSPGGYLSMVQQDTDGRTSATVVFLLPPDAFCGSIPHANYLSRHFFSNFSRFFFNFTRQKLFVENTPSRKNISPSRIQIPPSLNNFSCQAKSGGRSGRTMAALLPPITK